MTTYELKYRAQAKAFAKVISLSCDYDRAQRDVDSGLTGGVTIDEIKAVRDGLADEKEVWDYIYKLIEFDK